MNFKNTRRPNKTISPLMQRNVTPDILSKYNVQSTIQSSHVPLNPVLKQFTQSPATYQSKPKSYFRQQDYMHYSLSQLNLELDNNMNEIVFLLGKRKNLTNAKKKRLRQQMQQKILQAKNTTINNFQYLNDDQFAKIIQFCPNTNMAIKIISKIIQILPQMRGPKADQQQKSQQFWNNNRQIQNQIDQQLVKLKSIENQLQNENKQVIQLCKTLDSVQQKLKSIAGMKSQDHLQKVQPLFYSKKLNYDQLNGLVNKRQKQKDRKIISLKKLIQAINLLKSIRQSRLNQIAQFFGLDNVLDFDKYNFRQAGDFGAGFQQLIKLKQKSSYLQLSQKQIQSQLDKLTYQQQQLYSSILKKQSDQARTFHQYTNIMLQRVKYTSILNVFGSQMQQIFLLNQSDIFRKFKQYKGFLKKFIQQQGSIKLGLIKTRDTSITFQTLLKATQNQKQRRQQVLNLLQACLRKRGDYQHKKQDIRNLMVQMTKNQQLLSQFQQQLQGILSDGDINAYKTIGLSISKCEQQKCRLLHMKQRLQRQMDLMDRQVVGLANKIQGDYQDILKQVIPSDYQYSLTSSDDVKKLRNHLRKMYKRLGILKSQ